MTTQGDTGRDYTRVNVVNGDIIIKSVDGMSYTVNGISYIATSPTTASLSASSTNQQTAQISSQYSTDSRDTKDIQKSELTEVCQ